MLRALSILERQRRARSPLVRPSTGAPWPTAPVTPRRSIVVARQPSPSRAFNNWRRLQVAPRATVVPFSAPMPVLQAYPLAVGLSGDGDGCPAGMCPAGALTDQQLRTLGLDPSDVRSLDATLHAAGMGLGLDGIFDVIAAPFKAIGKVAVKAVRTLAPVAASFLPGPVGALARKGASLLAPRPGAPAPTPPTAVTAPVRFLPSIFRRVAEAQKKLGKTKAAEAWEKQARQVETIAERIAPTAPSIPSFPFDPSGPAPAAPRGGGAPAWLLPLALGAVALVVLPKLTGGRR